MNLFFAISSLYIIFIFMKLLFLQGGGKGSKAGLESCASSDSGGPLPKKHASDKKLTAEKKKMLKDKKRTLKRL